jgi:predicted acylesterase/phospholipase RssA
MTIKHLVISGGGSIGFQYMGALKYLNEKDYWNIHNIQTIYGTSVGSIIAVFLCLKFDWDTIVTYIIERPWQELFKLSGKQIMDAFNNKGVYDKKIIDTIFKPLLDAKDISLNITLKEFYEYSKIDLFIYTFELNTFNTIQLNYSSHPDLFLTTALTMSCAIPGVFMPIMDENNCFIDGGVMANYPLSFLLNEIKNRDKIDKTEILGFNYSIKNHFPISNINKESTIFDFILTFSVNAMNFITNSIQCEDIPNVIMFSLDESPLTMEHVKKMIKSMAIRKEFFDNGYEKAKLFLEMKI